MTTIVWLCSRALLCMAVPPVLMPLASTSTRYRGRGAAKKEHLALQLGDLVHGRVQASLGDHARQQLVEPVDFRLISPRPRPRALAEPAESILQLPMASPQGTFPLNLPTVPPHRLSPRYLHMVSTHGIYPRDIPGRRGGGGGGRPGLCGARSRAPGVASP